MSAPVVMVGGVFLECHSFSPQLTTGEHFMVVEGAELLRKTETSQSILSGGVRALQALGARVVPTFSAVAPPGGLADHAVYLAYRDRLVAEGRDLKPDAIFLELHGAMGTTAIDDAEGDLVGRLRDVVGPEVPIAAGLDMHACLSTAMLAATPLWVACKENPHTDYAAAGARAAELLMQVLAGQLSPVATAMWLPILLRGQLTTGQGPLADLHRLRRALETQAGVRDISIYNSHAFLDTREAGQCVTVLTDGLDGAAVAREISQALWDRREDYSVDRPSAEAVLADFAPGQGPLILGDHGDRVVGGSAGDGTYLMHLLGREYPALRALLPITDPAAVNLAEAAGVGAEITCALGGGVTPDELPVPGRWTVKHVGEGAFVQRGPFLAGEPADMGPCAVLTSGHLVVLVSTRPALSQDPECFLSQGEDPAAFDVVVCKSGFHFEPAFAAIGRTVAVDTPGITNYVPGHFKYVRRPVYWPEDSTVVPDFRAHRFPPALAAAT